MKALGLVITVLCAAATASRADDIAPKARTLAERGRIMHANGNYAGAIEAFKEAYVISPSPGLLFNLAQSYRLQADCENASIMYHRYLASDPPDEGRAIAEANLPAVERCAKEGVPLPPPPPPPHAAVTARTEPRAVDNGDEPSSHARLEKNIGIGFTLAGALALGGALYFELRAVNAADDVSKIYADGGKGSDVAPLDQRGRDAERDARMLAAGGTLAVIGGVALYLVGYRAERARPTVAIAPTRGGGHVSMSWAW